MAKKEGIEGEQQYTQQSGMCKDHDTSILHKATRN